VYGVQEDLIQYLDHGLPAISAGDRLVRFGNRVTAIITL
jgi:hypothetical protein